MTILSTIEIALDPIVEEAKAIASGAWSSLSAKAEAIYKNDILTLPQKAVALIKETSLGTAIANLISAAQSSTSSGADKFAAVLAAAEAAYSAFVSNGGLSGLISTGLSVLRQLVQSLYDDFAAAFPAL